MSAEPAGAMLARRKCRPKYTQVDVRERVSAALAATWPGSLAYTGEKAQTWVSFRLKRGICCAASLNRLILAAGKTCCQNGKVKVIARLKAMDHITPITTALAGLLGVALGGWITARTQRKQRVHDHIRKQLSDFYSPLLGMRARILAKSEARVKVSGATGEAWRLLVTRHRDDVETLRKLEQERFPDFEKVLEHNNRQLIEELLPLYRKMIDVFTDNMWLAESSTREHFGALVEFVEIWDRWLNGTLPKEAITFLGHAEEHLKPFYKDLVDQLNRLSEELKR